MPADVSSARISGGRTPARARSRNRARVAARAGAFDQVSSSSLAAQILDLPRVRRALEELFAGSDAINAPCSVHRALDVGLFASRFESDTVAPNGVLA